MTAVIFTIDFAAHPSPPCPGWVALSSFDRRYIHNRLRRPPLTPLSQVVHTITSSFTFFFLMTLLKSNYKRYISPQLSTASNLTLSSIAAMLNVVMTLPLDGLVTRIQTLSHQDPSSPPAPSSRPSPYAGLSPALLLSSNPALHHTVYDALKSYIFALKNMDDPTTPNYLDMGEAFAVGLMAKVRRSVASTAFSINQPLLQSLCSVPCFAPPRSPLLPS